MLKTSCSVWAYTVHDFDRWNSLESLFSLQNQGIVSQRNQANALRFTFQTAQAKTCAVSSQHAKLHPVGSNVLPMVP